MENIDLTELYLRESERVEWKENVADIDDVVKTAAAFANDYSNLGGGYIVCGAKETQDEHGFQKMIRIGLTSERLKEIEGKVLAELREKVSPPIVALTEEMPLENGKRILIFTIPATKHAHSYRASGKHSSTYYVRIGRETREARNGILLDLLVRKGDIEPWDKRINTKASLSDIDLLALRQYLKEMGFGYSNEEVVSYLSDVERISAFIPPLAEKESLTQTIKPRNFVLLMFSEPLKYYLGAFTKVSIYNGTDRSVPIAVRHDLTGNIVEQVRKALNILSREIFTIFNKNDKHSNQEKYSARAVQEAVVNALVHRDYEIDQPTRITVFNDRIEVYSPGALPKSINKEKFIIGKATPFWRNQSLAYFFNKLELAQAEGQGIQTMISTMRHEGSPGPQFELDEYSVTCILPANPRHLLIKDNNNNQ